VRADQVFGERAGEAWALLQEQTDIQLDAFGLAAIAKLGLAPGARVIDVGCGCGQTLLELADVVGPGGHVLGVDISEPMLARARERVAGRPAVELLCGDAQTHPFAPADFEALFSRFGVMFFQDTRAAFANLRRALRPLGRLAFVCWQPLSLNPWAEVPLRAVMRLLPPDALPDLLRPGCPGPFYLSDPDGVRTILSDAGFVGVEIDRLERPVHVGGAMTLEQATTYYRQIGPAARAIANAAPAPGSALETALEAALAGALAPFVSERGVWMDAAAFVVTATN
jgi:SAM-dependent methyltransferase